MHATLVFWGMVMYVVLASDSEDISLSFWRCAQSCRSSHSALQVVRLVLDHHQRVLQLHAWLMHLLNPRLEKHATNTYSRMRLG
jgi:hypothetical protein